MRTIRIPSRLVATLLGSFMVAGSVAGAGLEADLILVNGEIYTPNGWAQSMAIRNGVILAVGDAAAVQPLKAARTQTIDLKGATVVPGMHDLHLHPLGAGLRQQTCRITQGSSLEQVLDAVRDCVARHAKGEWITGGQWQASYFGKQPIDRTLLDKVAPDNPVILTDISGHSRWVNSKALNLAGVTAQTPDPVGGVIERDAKGMPTGILRETAGQLVNRLVPPPTAEQNAAALRWSVDHMLSYGITAFTDAAVDETGLKAYAALADQGVLKQRVRGCIVWRAKSLGDRADSSAENITLRNLYARERFKPDCIKVFLDGVPTEAHTAAMLEPYADAKSDDAHARGILMVPPKELNAAVVDFDRHGFTVKFHAAGDAAVRAGLDAIEAARKANGFTGNLHDVGHNSFVHMSDIARARPLGATFEMSPYIWYMQPIVPDNAKSVGPERMKRWIPVKDAIDSGALVVPGSDWSVVESVSPWIAMETLVTRQPPGGGGEPLGAVERITLQQAFDMFTVNAARQMGDANRSGAIERGMLADIVVLDRNPFKIPVTDIHNTQVQMTLINGEIVYRAPAQR